MFMTETVWDGGGDDGVDTREERVEDGQTDSETNLSLNSISL